MATKRMPATGARRLHQAVVANATRELDANLRAGDELLCAIADEVVRCAGLAEASSSRLWELLDQLERETRSSALRTVRP